MASDASPTSRGPPLRARLACVRAEEVMQQVAAEAGLLIDGVVTALLREVAAALEEDHAENRSPRSIAVEGVGRIPRFKMTAAPSETNAFGTTFDADASTTHPPRRPSLCATCQQDHCAVCAMEASGAHGGDGEPNNSPTDPRMIIVWMEAKSATPAARVKTCGVRLAHSSVSSSPQCRQPWSLRSWSRTSNSRA